MSNISASILDCDFENLEFEINKINNTKIKYLHIDIMDGVFVKRNTKSLFDMNKISQLTKKQLDIHLMVNEPYDILDKYLSFNPSFISIHIENNDRLGECINKIKSNNIGVGLAINPDTKISLLEPYLSDTDLVLIMSVYPGMGGQKFINSTIDRIKEINLLKKQKNFIISVDGGVNNKNSLDLISIEVDILVSGSFLIKSSNIKTATESLLNQ